jgi:HAD superfamily hydrolase (TIGR01509 family)
MNRVDWQRYQTILLDMDGTVLDLAFDNYFWRELVPRCLARARRVTPERAREDIFELYAGKEGSLDWYCLDYWSRELDLDLRALKIASSHRIGFLPGAREFLVKLAASGKHVALVTNAHSHTLAVKKDVAGLSRYFECFVSAHDFGYAKEQPEFWPQLESQLGFDLEATLFIDDSLPVLDAAAAFGLGEVVAVTRPDTRMPDKHPGTHRSVPGLFSLI